MQKDQNIRVAPVLWRIVIFIIYYIFLIGCGFALIWAAVKFTIWICNEFISYELYDIRVFLFILFLLLAIWCVVGLFAIYLIKPLFSISKNENPDRVEVEKDDAPLLFECIEDVVAKTGCKTPKHVYLTTAVNACVFYNTSFWSIFLPLRKNLEIGLGLFQSTDKEEVKAIIGHEFGHFAQSSMKVGSTVYIVNSILHNLVYANDFFEEWVNHLCQSNSSWIRNSGRVIRWLTNIVKKLNILVYKNVQRAYMKLSRQMEFNADDNACKNAGKGAFISSLCKVEITSQFQNLYEQFLQNLHEHGKTIKSYWTGYDVVREIVGNLYSYQFNDKVRLTDPIILEQTESRLNFENIWDSHPSIQKRIENASQTEYHSLPNTTEAWSMIPNDTKEKIGTYRLSQFINATDKETDIISDQEFHTWVTTEVDSYFIPLRLRPFLNRNILEFEFNGNTEETVENPFTEVNAKILNDYETGINDWNTLNAIVHKQIDVSTFSYLDNTYTRKSAPLEEHKKYVLELQNQAEVIDRNVFMFLMQHCEDSNKLKYAYACIFSSYSVMPILNDIAEQRAMMVSKWNQYGGRTGSDFETLLSWANNVLSNRMQLLQERINWNLMATIADEDTVNEMKSFVENPRIDSFYEYSDGVNKFNEAFSMIDKMGYTFQHMGRVGKHIIIQEAKKTLFSDSSDTTT